MSRSHARGSRRADDAGKVAAAVGFSARLDDIEDRPGAAALAGADDVESDAIDGRIFQHQAAQFLAIDRKRAAVERQARAELNVGDWMDCKGQLHATISRSQLIDQTSILGNLCPRACACQLVVVIHCDVAAMSTWLPCQTAGHPSVDATDTIRDCTYVPVYGLSSRR